MTLADLQSFIFDQIPLSRAMGVTIVRADSLAAELSAPLSLNHNHHGTVFGGSLNAVLILSCYSWLQNFLSSQGHVEHVVLRHGNIEFLRPVSSDFTATAVRPPEEELKIFLNHLQQKGSARISLTAEVQCESKSACKFVGEFVAKIDKSSRTTSG